MKRLAIPAAWMALWLSGCATSMHAGPRPAVPPPRLTPNLGEPSPATGTESNEAPQTLNRPITPEQQGGASSGPSLGSPEARRRGDLSQTARLEAPSPKRQTTNYRPGTQFTATDPKNLLREPSWSRFYRSTDRRPIETTIVGKGGRRVAVIASVHGDEPQSVGLVEELSRYLHAHPELVRGSTVLLIRDPNPDGLEGRNPYNIQGIDLNRNFPGDNWKMLRSRRSGETPNSAIETRAMVRILGDFKPQLLLHIKDARSVGIVNYDGDAEAIAERVSELSGLQVTQGLGKKTTGSVENYVGSRLNSASVTILVPREADSPAAWNKHQESLLAAIFNDTTNRTETRKPLPPPHQQAPDAEPTRTLPDTAAEQDPFEPRVQPSSIPMRRSRPGDIPGIPNTGRFPGAGRASGRPIPEQGYVELSSPPGDD